MRRRVRLSLVLAIGLVAMLGLAPAMLAKQGEQGEQVRIDPTSDFTDGITIESDEKAEQASPHLYVRGRGLHSRADDPIRGVHCRPGPRVPALSPTNERSE